MTTIEMTKELAVDLLGSIQDRSKQYGFQIGRGNFLALLREEANVFDEPVTPELTQEFTSLLGF